MPPWLQSNNLVASQMRPYFLNLSKTPKYKRVVFAEVDLTDAQVGEGQGCEPARGPRAATAWGRVGRCLRQRCFRAMQTFKVTRGEARCCTVPA